MRWLKNTRVAPIESWSFIRRQWWDEKATLKHTTFGWWYKTPGEQYQKIEGVSTLAEAKAYIETLHRMGEL